DAGSCWECGYERGRGQPVVVFRTDVRAGDQREKAPYNLMLAESATVALHLPFASTEFVLQELLRTLAALQPGAPAAAAVARPAEAPAAGGFPAGLSTVDATLFDRVWQVVQECGEEERHFNQLQSVYRGIASTWLLATFAGVGYILYGHETPAPGPDVIVPGLICLSGAVGIALIWLLDMHVYHRLLVSIFDEGRKLEQSYPWLPRFRTRMSGVGMQPGHRRQAVRD